MSHKQLKVNGLI